MSLFPNFTPEFLYCLFARLTEQVESSSLLRTLCTVNIFGFNNFRPSGVPD